MCENEPFMHFVFPSGEIFPFDDDVPSPEKLNYAALVIKVTRYCTESIFSLQKPALLFQ